MVVSLRHTARTIAFAVVLLLVLPVLAIVLVNLPDEALSAAASARLAYENAPAAGNDAAALWAFDAPPGVDAVLVGRAVYDSYQGLAHDDPLRADWTIKRFYADVPFQFPRELACGDPQSACVPTYLEQAQRVQALAGQQAALLERLGAIDGAAQWHELAPPASPQAPQERLTALTSIFSLSLGTAALDVVGGRSQAGVARLEQDTRIARRVMGASDSLLCKMVATDMLRRALLAYSELLSTQRSSAAQVTALTSSLERVAGDLTPAERSLAAPLDYEARILRTLVLQLAHGDTTSAGSPAERLALFATPVLLKPDATTNLQSELLDLETPLMTRDAAGFALGVGAVREALTQRSASFAALDWRALYNPLGKTLASDPPDLTGAAARVHDVEVLLRAVRLKARMERAAVPFADAQRFATSSEPRLVDPYSGAPFEWRAADAALVLPQQGSHPVRQIAIPLASGN